MYACYKLIESALSFLKKLGGECDGSAQSLNVNGVVRSSARKWNSLLQSSCLRDFEPQLMSETAQLWYAKRKSIFPPAMIDHFKNEECKLFIRRTASKRDPGFNLLYVFIVKVLNYWFIWYKINVPISEYFYQRIVKTRKQKFLILFPIIFIPLYILKALQLTSTYC